MFGIICTSLAIIISYNVERGNIFGFFVLSVVLMFIIGVVFELLVKRILLPKLERADFSGTLGL